MCIDSCLHNADVDALECMHVYACACTYDVKFNKCQSSVTRL
jgi:hypothetical protein